MTVPATRRSRGPESATPAVHATEPLTHLIAGGVADSVFDELSRAVGTDRADSELTMFHAFAAHDDVVMEVSGTFAAILERAQEASRLSGGLVHPVVEMAPTDSGGAVHLLHPDDPFVYDAATGRLYLRRGTVLDLWDIGCAWAAEEIVSRVLEADPAAALAAVVGPAVVSVGAAWEIVDALGQEFSSLHLPLRCGLRSFAVLGSTARITGPRALTPDAVTGAVRAESAVVHGRWWDSAVVGADDAVRALTFAMMAERLGGEAFDYIVDGGAEAEFQGYVGAETRLRLLRTPGWVPKAS